MAHWWDPYENTVEAQRNHGSRGGGGGYTGRRVDETMQVIHAEVPLRATPLGLEFAVETGGGGGGRSGFPLELADRGGTGGFLMNS